MIVITGSAVIRPQCISDAIAVGIEHSARSRAEPGCLAHNCHVDSENAQRIVFVEEWADMSAVKAHFAVPQSGEFVRALTAMAVAPPTMRIFRAEEIAS